MRNLLAFVAALAITFLGLGWYLDWYKIRPVSGQPGHQSFTVDINADKINDSVQKGVHKIEQESQDLLQPKGETAAAPKVAIKVVDGKATTAPR